MSVSNKVVSFQSLTENVGRFNLSDKKLLIPDMNHIGTRLIAAVFRGFGIHAIVMSTCKGLDLGMEYTSGKECYPCQITTGDILYTMKQEKERLGDDFDANNYIYFMPQAEGPCRFGMYNKYQRIVLDSFPGLDRLKIGALTTGDGYSLAGIVAGEKVTDLRKTAYFSLVVSDVLDRLLWRIRPYEKEVGAADALLEESTRIMEKTLEQNGAEKPFKLILERLEDIIENAKSIMDPAISPKPLIGMVGEIYLRTHTGANQDVIRELERYGAEVVNASVSEWVNFTSYERLRDVKKELRLSLKQFHVADLMGHLRQMLGYGGDLFYQQFRQKQIYKRATAHMDLVKDHKIAHLEETVKADDLFSFDAGTEACLSISGIMEYAREGYNGVVNVYPFTCMPSTITSAIAKPLMSQLRMPYLDTPYDSSVQPGREAAIRTFMYQAHQHFKKHGRKGIH